MQQGVVKHQDHRENENRRGGEGKGDENARQVGVSGRGYRRGDEERVRRVDCEANADSSSRLFIGDGTVGEYPARISHGREAKKNVKYRRERERERERVKRVRAESNIIQIVM